VAELLHLLQLVGDEDDRAALVVSQAAERGEELGLLRG
jgi:hypothetical protein